MSLLGRTLGQAHCHWYVCRPGLLFGHPWTRYYMSYKNVVNTTQQENTRSNKNVKFFWRKPFSVETPSLGEKSFLGRSHFWGEALFGEKPFSGRSHFLGRSHFRGEAIFQKTLLPLPCKECLKSFSESGSLKTHLRLIQEKKSFTCKECSK